MSDEECTILKRGIDSSDFDSSQETCKRRKNSNDTFTCLPIHKSSIQYIHEIANIQPIKFEMISQEGKAHKPVFKFCLNIVVNFNNVQFFSIGNSKKQAKIIASIKALTYLTKLPNFFQPNEIESFKNVISIDLKNNNIELEMLDDAKEENDLTGQTELLIVESNPLVNQIEQTRTNKIELDLKTKEIIATKNSLTIINHLLPKKYYSDNLVEESGQSHSKIFKFELRVNKLELKMSNIQLAVDINQSIETDKDSSLFQDLGNELVFYGIGSNKKIAKSRAAQFLLEVLFNIKILNPVNELSLGEEHDEQIGNKFKDFADNISELINKKYKELVDQLSEDNEFNPNKFLNVYSGIIQSNGIDFSTSKLICITTGTKCVGGEYMSLSGTSLNDCHAEILAVRVLRRYLFQSLENFIKNNFESDIFELNSDTNPRFRLKNNVNFHLFISSAPCGDSRIFSLNDNTTTESIDAHPNRKVRGLLRAKVESGMGTIPVRSFETIQTWDGILLGERLKTMSCSDKLCKYNTVGIQGALLSQFMLPIYFDSIIVGAFYNKNHLARALYGRVCDSESNLPKTFKVNKPILSSITNSLQRQTSKPSTKSLIWSDYLSQIEIINCKLGKKEDGNHSEICKYEMYKLWLEILKLMNINDQDDMNQLKDLTYKDAKTKAHNYQQAKLEFYKNFDRKGLGKWLTAPIEQNNFSLS